MDKFDEFWFIDEKFTFGWRLETAHIKFYGQPAVIFASSNVPIIDLFLNAGDLNVPKPKLREHLPYTKLPKVPAGKNVMVS